MKKRIRMLLLIFFIAVLSFSLWRLWGIFREYLISKENYRHMEQYVSFEMSEETIETVTETGSETSSAQEREEPRDLSSWPQVDFEQLSQINPDVVGWIYIEGTNINYPIVQGTDNQYYLTHMFDGRSNGAGCIFLDAVCESDFSGKHSILYGHHMKDKSMFAGLMKYKNQSYYNEHSAALMVTPAAYYKIRFFSGYVSDTEANAWELQFDEHGYALWLEEIQKRSCFASEYNPTTEDKIVTLSTCTYEFGSAKFVLHGYISEYIEKSSDNS